MSNEQPFSGIRTFLKSKLFENKNAIFGFYGIPFDLATTNRPGARFGPSAVREASLMLTDGIHPIFNTNPSDAIVDLGDIRVSSSITETIDIISKEYNFLKLHPLSVGGDHSVTLGILRGLIKDDPVGVLHFDAHSDTSETHFGEKIGHGTWLRNAIEEGLVDPTRTVSIGVRAPSQEPFGQFLKEKEGTTWTAVAAMNHFDELVKLINFKCTGRMYLSFDIDSLDPSQAPGTGTPEIAGLTTQFVRQLFPYLSNLDFIGMDLVEVAPGYDNSQITALAGATIIWEYACMVLAKNFT